MMVVARYFCFNPISRCRQASDYRKGPQFRWRRVGYRGDVGLASQYGLFDMPAGGFREEEGGTFIFGGFDIYLVVEFRNLGFEFSGWS